MPLSKDTFRQLLIIIGILVALIIALGYSGLLSTGSIAAYQVSEPLQHYVSQLDAKSLLQFLANLNL